MTTHPSTARHDRRSRPLLLVSLLSASLVSATVGFGALAAPAQAQPPVTASSPETPRVTDKNPVAVGWGGAVSSVDPEATAAGLRVLRRGGNAVDAAVATAAALGVTEPYSAGIGGGGYFVYYDAKTRRVHTIDGRETAPAAMNARSFLDPATGVAYPFATLVNSGISVGVPGTPATWERAVDRWGRRSLAANLAPAIDIARRGFVVDATFNGQTNDNAARFAKFASTAKLYLPSGKAPAVGSIFTNPELADTYAKIAERGPDAIYRGAIAREIVATVQKPPTVDGSSVLTGSMTTDDLRGYRVRDQKPTKVSYRGLDVYGMAPSSSGGTTVGEALNILENYPLGSLPRAQALHDYLEASALAFADRGANVGDPAFVDVPTETLLSQRFADSRACQISPTTALPKPVKAGDLKAPGCATSNATSQTDPGKSTTHLVTSDRWGNVVSYTLTIEQTGGSGIVVPGRGFLLNNELTDFSATPPVAPATDPNQIGPGKRPRSSMSPTIVLRNGKPFLAVGSPGGATIITTVLQTLVNRIDFRMGLLAAVAAPRASQRNAAATNVEPAFKAQYDSVLSPYGHQLTVSGDTFTSAQEIGAVAALEFYPHGFVQAVAEPVRRGGGSAGVVHPNR